LLEVVNDESGRKTGELKRLPEIAGKISQDAFLEDLAL